MMEKSVSAQKKSLNFGCCSFCPMANLDDFGIVAESDQECSQHDDSDDEKGTLEFGDM
jgi:hypothetical protein